MLLDRMAQAGSMLERGIMAEKGRPGSHALPAGDMRRCNRLRSRRKAVPVAQPVSTGRATPEPPPNWCGNCGASYQ